MRIDKGVILKGIGGFYYVEISNGIIYECKARGLFRKNKVKPYVGDKVVISIISFYYHNSIFNTTSCITTV